MPADDDVFSGGSGASGSHFLAPANAPPPRRSPSRQSLSMSRHRSTASLRGAPGLALVQGMDDDGASGRHSLAHELAVALLPEPSAGSKLLAEEFGIEYDEGAEGIDGEGGGPAPGGEDGAHEHGHEQDHALGLGGGGELGAGPSFADELAGGATLLAPPGDAELGLGSPAASPRKRPEVDAMAVLAQDLESTEKFLTHLRRLDADAGGGAGGGQPALEKMASDVIRKIEETARDREGQVRELLEYEREFRKIAGEVGGGDALAALDALDGMDDPEDSAPAPTNGDANAHAPRLERRRTLDQVVEDASFASSNDWEVDPDRHMDDDEDEYGDTDAETPSPTKDAFALPPPPPITGPMTPAKTIPQLAHLRTYTTSLVASLTVISEQAQVNGAATTEAGRKIRALKNKLGGWRTDWDSAERSRVKIERWEAGMPDSDGAGVASTPTKGARRVDGRKLVEEHLRAFESALAEANVKTQAIMAAS